MPLSWNEIKTRATAFIKEWQGAENEEAEAKEFLIEFLNVFGVSRRKVATFEHKVKKLNDADGYIDLLWKGWLLVEMKSKGKDLEKAYKQAKDYCAGLKDHELPKLIMVCDFHTFHVYDENGEKTVFTLDNLLKSIQVFAPIAGYEKRTYKEQDPVNIEAAELMGKLHDKLKEIGYAGHQLELYLVRLLFCLFADDTNIFENGTFHDYIELKTNEDGSDLAAHISQIFQILNTAEDKRLKNLDEALNAFPYVNGKLFEEVLPMASFDSSMRKILIDSCKLDWGKISPAIFGSLFQSVMDEKARRNLGAHYTSEKNILKLIKPLFLDELWQEFETIKNDKKKLQKLHEKISKLRFLDPACGCGNFLIIAYKELRTLELEIVKALLKGQQVTSINDYFLVDVDQFFGIEYEEFPSQIAQVAMWLIDHQMNEKASFEFGDYFKRIPLKKSATIVWGNALRIDWQSLLQKESTVNVYADVANVFQINEPEEEYKTVNVFAQKINVNPTKAAPVSKLRFQYILGNPPFIGKKEQNLPQKEDMDIVCNGIKGYGILDYVAAWYIKAAKYLQQYQIEEKDVVKTKVAFVSTNSICQGEQVSILWNDLFSNYKIKIHFAHRTFRWSNEAKGNAAVHVVIVGFSNFDALKKNIYEYEDIKGEPHSLEVKNINAYLVEGNEVLLSNRKTPLCNTQEIVYGSFALDDGNYTLSEDDKKEILKINSNSENLIKPFIGGRELLHSEKRYCLWLADASPLELKSNPKIIERIESVRKWRANSDRTNTKKLAETPTLFAEVRQPKTNYLAFPTLSSVNRNYIPIAFLSPNTIASNQLYIVPNSDLFSFGLLTSFMHMTWTKYVCGRFKSDYRYSASIVYNNFPWAENPTDKQMEAVEKAAQGVLDARAMFPNSSLADLYDPNTIPPALVKAHQQLDKAVDLCYRKAPFESETKRIEFLFELYEKYTAGLFAKEKKTKKK